MDRDPNRRTYISRIVERLSAKLSFHPVAIAAPELASCAYLADHVLLRLDPDGYHQLILIIPCDAPDDRIGGDRLRERAAL